MFDKPATIEELADMREWMQTIPEMLIQHQEILDHAILDYDLIEEFNYNISNDDFTAK